MGRLLSDLGGANPTSKRATSFQNNNSLVKASITYPHYLRVFLTYYVVMLCYVHQCSIAAVGKLGVATLLRVAKLFRRAAKKIQERKIIAKFLIKNNHREF